MSRGMWLVLFLIIAECSAVSFAQTEYPPPRMPSEAQKQELGLHIQRTMTLLATSTPEHHNKVKVLFYGQSITEQEWSKQVADDLRHRFPNADLDIENRAIGGFASQLLIRPAEHDLYPFYPDLLIFHVYGSNKEYEQIIRNVRSRTTAEVLMQKDHLTRWPPATIDREKDKGAWWDNLMNTQFLPQTAAKYGCGLADNRTGWIDYLKDNHLEPKALLKDGVHLNAHGNYLMAQLVERNLVYRPDLTRDEWQNSVKTYEVGKDVSWKDGKLTLQFDGNRIDAIAASDSDGRSSPATIFIDGKKPSEFPGCYAITRPTPGPWSALALTRVDHEKPLLIEKWTLKITKVSEDSSSWDFNVAGSVTGPDGSGSSSAPFASPSGRVAIDPAAWFRKGNLKVGYEIHWTVVPMFVDQYQPVHVDDQTREAATVIAQGLDNGPHTLEIDSAKSNGQFPLHLLRIYRPPVKMDSQPTTAPTPHP